MHELQARGPSNRARGAAPRALRQGQRARHRRAGPGRPDHRARRQDPDYPTHAASKPVAMIPELRGHAPRAFRARRQRPGLRSTRRRSTLWPDVHWAPDDDKRRRVDLDTLTQRRSRRAGSRARRCCSTARCSPAATPRTSASRTCSAKGEPLPVDFTNRVIYYVGPVDPVRDEVVGPAGPTTATRMDKFTEHDARADRPDRHDRQGRARPGRRSRRSASTRRRT